MTEYLRLKTSNCKHCYKCIRHCPVKAIAFSRDQANIVQDECILCGQCFVNCPQNAKYIRNDIEDAKALIASGAPVVASLAPSAIANYPHASIASIRRALQALGFADVQETALGATLVKQRYDELVNAEEQPVIISSCCHSINVLIQKYFPDALPYLAKVASPMLVHGRMIKEAQPEAKVVFIGPCISKMAEAAQYPGSIDVALTFDELNTWLEEAGITMEAQAEAPGGKARLFPIPGGILRSMEASNKRYEYLVVDGVENCIAALKDIISGALPNCFVELSACTGGCVGGPVMNNHPGGKLRDFMSINKCAGKEDFAVERLPEAQLEKNIPFAAISRQKPGHKAIEDVLRKTKKTKPEDELNCGSCGYDTCREKAEAVLQGKAELSMCLPYLMARAQSFSDTIIYNTPNGIIVLNEELEVQQINQAARRIMNIGDKNSVLNRQVVCILDPTPFMEVLRTHKNIYERHVYLAEYQRTVTQTIVYDADYHVLISIMRDITEEEKNRTSKEALSRNTIEITDKVIEKQMRAVQEIASLLGETTAETKIALSKLKETFADE